MQCKKIEYKNLNSRQQENYNFQKVAAAMADYGFNCLRLTDDWQGADFIAIHIDGKAFLKVQLKGRFSLYRKYEGKNIWIAFRQGDIVYLYNHDKVLKEAKEHTNIHNTKSWKEKGGYSVNQISMKKFGFMEKYQV